MKSGIPKLVYRIRFSPRGKNWIIAIAIGIFVSVVTQLLSRVSLLSLCVLAVSAAIAQASLESRRLALEKTDGELVPQIMDSVAISISSGASLVEALDNLLLEGQPKIRVKVEKLQAIFDSNLALEEKVNGAKKVLNSREGDLFLELILIAARRGDDFFADALRTLSESFRNQQNLARELLARQGWVLATARLGLASPWIVVLLLSVRPETALAYDSEVGSVVLISGLALSFGAHRLIAAGSKVPQWARNLQPSYEGRV